MFGRAITRAFWVFYENFFKGMMLNILLFFIYLPVFALVWKTHMFICIFIMAFIWHIITPAIMYFWAKIIRDEDRKNMFLEIWDGLKLFGLKGAGLFVINMAMAYLVFIGIDFYKAHASNKVFLVLGGIGIWLAFTFLLMQIYLMPIMVMDEKRRVLISYKKSLIMLLSGPFSSIGVLAVIGYFSVMMWPIVLGVGGAQASRLLIYFTMFPIFLMPFLSIIYVILLQLNATILMYEKHNIMPNMKEKWEDKKWSNLFRPWEVK